MATLQGGTYALLAYDPIELRLARDYLNNSVTELLFTREAQLHY